jgi:Fe-S cluster assembly protein SufD
MINLIEPDNFTIYHLDLKQPEPDGWLRLYFTQEINKPIWLQTKNPKLKLEINVNQTLSLRFFWCQLESNLAPQELQLVVNLNHPNCRLGLYNFYYLEQQNQVRNQLQINHWQPNCYSYTLSKGVLQDQAQAWFGGKIFVASEAHQTDAKLANHTLLLSDEAKMESKPELEIFCDDVKCTHGATIGSLDRQQVFYLQSRGIDKAVRESLLIQGFLQEVINSVIV